jgi:hypothetical protein
MRQPVPDFVSERHCILVLLRSLQAHRSTQSLVIMWSEKPTTLHDLYATWQPVHSCDFASSQTGAPAQWAAPHNGPQGRGSESAEATFTADVRCISLSPDDKLIATAADKDLCIYD